MWDELIPAPSNLGKRPAIGNGASSSSTSVTPYYADQSSELRRVRTDLNNMRREMTTIVKQFETQQGWMAQATITIDKMFNWILPKANKLEAIELSAAMGALSLVEQQQLAQQKAAELEQQFAAMSVQQQQLMM